MSTALPLGRSAELHVLFTGYVGSHVASTISFVRDGDVRTIIDPGMAPCREAILEPLAALGVAPEAITDVNVFLVQRPLADSSQSQSVPTRLSARRTLRPHHSQ
jgi:hypothetical protein